MAYSVGDEADWEGWLLCDENGKVFDLGPDGRYPHKFLVADDTYAPNFSEYVGLTIGDAMRLELNEINTMQSDEIVSSNFETISISERDVKKKTIDGTLPEIIDVCDCAVSGGVSQILTYQGKAIYDSSTGGRQSTWIISNANAQTIVSNQTQFSEIGSIAHDGPPISVLKYEDDTSVTDTIGSSEVPGDAICKFANSPKFKVS